MNEIYRMLDANINRVCEGLRVLEDLLRFSEKESTSFQEIRNTRRSVRNIFRKYDSLFFAGRNAATDPGVGESQQGMRQEKRNAKSIFIANFKRVQEGLRVIAELCRMLNLISEAKATEKIRFIMYDVEKKNAALISREFPKGLYAITAEKFSLGRKNTAVVRQLIKAGVDVIQYREKANEKTFRQMLCECREIRKMTEDAGIPFIINDYPELAHLTEADGVHIGQEDYPVTEVRKLMGNKWIGVSTHSPEQARQALADGADYIGVGPLFQTHTKENVCAPVGLDYLEYVIKNIPLPHVAIGGIKRHNLKQVLQFPVWSVSLVTGLVGAEHIEEEVRYIKEQMKQKGCENE